MEPFFPSNLQEFIEERISFCKACLKGYAVNPHEKNKAAIALFQTSLVDLEFCLKVFIDYNADSKNNRYWISVCAAHMKSVILSCYQTMLSQEFEVTHLGGEIFVSNMPASWVPLEVKAYNEKMKICLSKIFDKLMEIEDIKN